MMNTIGSDATNFAANEVLAVVVAAEAEEEVAAALIAIEGPIDVATIGLEDEMIGQIGIYNNTTQSHFKCWQINNRVFFYSRGRGRPDYRDYQRGGGRDRFSPDRGGPPMKRMRPDWGDDGRPRYGGKFQLGNYTQ